MFNKFKYFMFALSILFIGSLTWLFISFNFLTEKAIVLMVGRMVGQSMIYNPTVSKIPQNLKELHSLEKVKLVEVLDVIKKKPIVGKKYEKYRVLENTNSRTVILKDEKSAHNLTAGNLVRSLFIHDITTANKNKNEYGFLRRSSASTHLFGKLMSVFIKANHVIWGSSLKKEPDIIRLIGNNNDNPEVIEDLIDVQMGLDIEYTYKYFGFRGHGILKGGYAHPPTRPFEVSGPVYFKNKQIGSIIVIRTSLTGEAYVAIYDSKGVQIN